MSKKFKLFDLIMSDDSKRIDELQVGKDWIVFSCDNPCTRCNIKNLCNKNFNAAYQEKAHLTPAEVQEFKMAYPEHFI